MERYEERPPPHTLSRFIECVWTLTPASQAGHPSLHRVFPDGAVDIVICAEQAVIHGPANSFRVLSVDAQMLGFRIRPGAAKTLLGVSPTELPARPTSLEALWGSRGHEIECRLAAEPGPAALVRLMTGFLADRADFDMDLDNAVLATVDRINYRPTESVRSLSQYCGLSERQMRRRFETHLGLGVKEYARIIRFQRLLDTVRDHTRCLPSAKFQWSGLAWDHGFADQAHLIREVQTFAGLTPTQLSQVVRCPIPSIHSG
jgi:AraC-like DNA-binding protein